MKWAERGHVACWSFKRARYLEMKKWPQVNVLCKWEQFSGYFSRLQKRDPINFYMPFSIFRSFRRGSVARTHFIFA